MAAVATPAEKATDLMGKLTLDANNKAHDASEVTKKPTGLQYGSVGGKEGLSAANPPYERSLTPLLQEYVDANMCFLPNGYPSTTPYYYGGYDPEDYPRYMNPDGVEMPPPGVYGDMYHHGYGYAPYGAYPSPASPVPTMGHDGQLYGPQQCQYPATYYQPPAPPSAPYTRSQAPTSQGEVSTSVASDQAPISVDTTKAKSNGIANGSAPSKQNQQYSSLNSNGSSGRGVLSGGHQSSGYQDPRFGFNGIPSPVSWYDGPVYPDGQHRPATTAAVSSIGSHISNSTSSRNQNLRPLPHYMGLHTPRPTSGMAPAAPGIMNRMYPNNRIYTQCGNAFRNGLGSGSNFYDSRANGHWVVAEDNKYKPRGRGNGLYGYGNENLDGLSELNRGPRAGRFRNQKGFGSPITIVVKGQNLPTNGNIDVSCAVPDRDQFNRADFPESYSDARFFVIKSYSEDDVHKSIKYSVWASTPNGNKKLDAAYQESQDMTSGCPVFLLFSVNTSGQFVGVAEMVGPVDFNKTVEYWQQDKWTGCFPVKWHIVKDVPNNILKHITLENNENKPVTNSRDTQEVKLEQGLQVLKLFKEHASKTSILDDFGFYESRQKSMQENRAKQQQLQKQVADKLMNTLDEKDKDGATGKPRLQKPFESVTVLKKEAEQVGLLERKPSNENGAVAAVAGGDAPKTAKPVIEAHLVANGVANGF